MDPEMYETDDMGLAAYLSLSWEVEDVRWKPDGCYWYFKNVPGLSDQVAAYHGNTAQVSPKQYNNHFARLKKEMFEMKDGGRTSRHGG